MSSAKCPLCGARKPKRACPALGQSICAVCCGTKRIVEIRCPASCPYLATARDHPAAVIQRRQERDLAYLIPLLSELTDSQYRLLLFFQGVALRQAEGAIPPLLDQDVAAAATAFAATLETAGKGIIYQHQASAIPAQRLVAAFETAFGELRSRAGSRAASLERDAMVALRRLVKACEEAARALPGDEPPVYLKLIRRVMESTEGAAAPQNPADEAGPSGRLIVPG